MTSRFSRQLRRWALLGLIVVGSTNPVAVTHAQELDGDSGYIPASADWCGWGTHDTLPCYGLTNSSVSKAAEEASDHVADEVMSAQPSVLRPASRTASGFEQSLAALAAAATAKVGVSFEQIVEPFAMVSTEQANSVDQVNHFKKWWSFALLESGASSQALIAGQDAGSDEQAESGPQNDADFAVVSTIQPRENVYVPFIDFTSEVESVVTASESTTPDWYECDDDGFSIVGSADLLRRSLDLIAQEEPIDANVGDDLNRVFAKPFEGLPSMTESVAEVEEEAPAAADHFVGTGPFILTLDEPYMPYDFAQRDIPVWLPMSLTRPPFCVLASKNDAQPDPMWTESVQETLVSKSQPIDPISSDAVSSDAVSSDEETRDTDAVRVALLQASADCLLDEWIWNVEQALESGSSFRRAISLEQTGHKLGWYVNQSNRAASKASQWIAQVWPAMPAKPAASRLLLTRAGAVESAPDDAIAVDPVAAEQLAQTIDAIRGWWANAQGIPSSWLQVAGLQSSPIQNR